MTRGRAIIFALVLLAGCDKFVRHAPKGPPPSEGVVREMCASDLGGPRASLRVWRDSEGEVTVLELRPDPKARARASCALYDGRGREVARIAPILEPGSPQALEADRKREAVIEDSRLGETLSCALDGGTGK